MRYFKNVWVFGLICLLHAHCFAQEIEEDPILPYVPEENPDNAPFIIDDDDDITRDYDWPVRDLPDAAPIPDPDLSAEETKEKERDDEYLNALFNQTTKKGALALTQVLFPDVTYLVCDVFSFPWLLGKPSDKENHIYKDPYERYVNTLLPGVKDQDSKLESIFDQELLRDINQVVAYTEQGLNYGLNLVVNNEKVMDRISPERLYDEEEFEEEEEVEEEEEYLYNGMTQEQYIAEVQNTIASFEEMELSGSEAENAEMMTEAINILAEDGDDERVTQMMTDIMSGEDYSEETTDEELEVLVSEYIEGRWEQMVDVGQDDSEQTGEIKESVAQTMTDEGLSHRNIRARYGDAAEPHYSEYEAELKGGNAEAKEILTKALEAWAEIQEGKYIEKAILMEKVGREIIENGDAYVDGYKNITGEGDVMTKILELVKLIGNGAN